MPTAASPSTVAPLTSFNRMRGIESALITLNGGIVSVVSSDDATNVTDGSGSRQPGGGGPGEGRPGEQQRQPTPATFFLIINGGTLIVNAGGDGLDNNGAIEMNGGLVIVNGPTEQMNGALDLMHLCDERGYLVAVGETPAWRKHLQRFRRRMRCSSTDQTLPVGVRWCISDRRWQ